MRATLLKLNIHFLDYVIDRPDKGFPSAVMVECIEPSGYITNWADQIWRKGRWQNLEYMSEPAGSTGEIPKPRCIDPFKCYSMKPKLPPDYTVEIIADTVDTNENSVNTTFTYKCSKESKQFNLQDSYLLKITSHFLKR